MFKSSEPEALAKATSLLSASGIPFRIIDRNERSRKVPQRVHWLFVSPRDAAAAMQKISEVPSEVILEQKAEPITPQTRAIAWMQLITLAVVLLFGIIMAILNR